MKRAFLFTLAVVAVLACLTALLEWLPTTAAPAPWLWGGLGVLGTAGLFVLWMRRGNQ